MEIRFIRRRCVVPLCLFAALPGGVLMLGRSAIGAEVAARATASKAETSVREHATPEQIEQWIRDLDSDFYVTRERATESLAEAGPSALPLLSKAADGGNLEVATRAVRAMFQISQADKGQHARAALTAIAKLSNRPADRSAAETILSGLREREAMAIVKAAGGIVEREYEVDGEVMIGQLRIGADWQGGDAKLAHVADLKSLQILMLHGAPITDAGLAHLHDMKKLLQVQVYGTGATPEGAAKLRAALPGAEIDYRAGALLGVRGAIGFQGGALVEAVQDDTAAQEADIRRGDVIVKCNGKQVNSFTELKDMIAECKPGDTAKIELLRGGEVISKDVTFGGFK